MYVCRIHQGDATSDYVKLVAGRFAALSEIGELKLEAFAPTGGGTVRRSPLIRREGGEGLVSFFSSLHHIHVLPL